MEDQNLIKQIMESDGDINGMDEFVTLVALRAGFTKGDVADIIRAIVEIFEEAVKHDKIIFVRKFGTLYVRTVGSRQSSKAIKGGIILPETKKVTFRLAENIRKAWMEKDTR